MGNVIKLNKAQKQAVYSNKKLIVVNSSAGTGKTTVLTSRIMRLLKEGISFDNILALTFTNNAAAEMKSRLQKKLQELITKTSNQKLKTLLKKQLNLLPNSYISTFHSFCKRILEKEVDIYRSKILNIAPISLLNNMQEEVILDLIDEFKKDKNNFDFLVEHTALIPPSQFFENIKKNIRYFEFEGEVLNKKDYTKTLTKESFQNKMVNSNVFPILLLRLLIELKNVKPAFLKKVFNTEKTKKTFSDLSKWMGAMTQPPIDFIKKMQEYPFKNLVLKNMFEIKNIIYKSYKKALKEEKRWFIKREVEGLISIIEVISKLDFEMNHPMKKKFNTDEIFSNFVRKATKLFKQKKAALDCYSYDDLINIFRHEFKKNNYENDLFKTIKNRFKFIFIDEFQDTSIYQYEFVEKLETEKDISLFIVGDSKQSIYRFNDARPELFNRIRLNAKANKKEGEVVSLQENFRSNREIITFVNDTFREIFYNFGHEENFLYYEEDELIDVLGKSKSKNKRFKPVEIINIKNKAISWDKGLDYCLEEAFRLIRTLVDTKTHKFSDFMILTRNNLKYSLVTCASKKFGIPIKGTFRRVKAYQSSFYCILYNFLRTIANKNDDIAFLSTAKYLFNITDEDFVVIKTVCLENDDQLEFYLKIPLLQLIIKFITIVENSRITYGEQVNNILYKAKKLLEELEKYIEIFNNTNYSEAINLFLFKHKYYSKVAQYCSRDESMMWYRILQKKLNDFEAYPNQELENLIHVLDNGDRNLDENLEVNVIDDDNSVTLLTAHGAKGLEAKFVFYINQSARYTSNQEFSSEEGIQTDYYNIKTVSKVQSPIKTLINANERFLCLYDAIRLFYVITTRAKENLFILSCNLGVKPLNWNFKLIRSFVEWLIAYNDEDDKTRHSKLISYSNKITPDPNLKMKEEEKYKFDSMLKNRYWKYKNEEINEEKLNQFLKKIDEEEKIKEDKTLKIDLELIKNEEKGMHFGSLVHKLFELVLRSIIQKDKVNFQIIEKITENYLILFKKNIQDKKIINELKNYVFSFFKSKQFTKWIMNGWDFYPEFIINAINDQNDFINRRIDLLITNEENAIILDFKTNLVKHENELIELYRNQLMEYANIIHNKFKKVECLIYSTKLKKFIKINM